MDKGIERLRIAWRYVRKHPQSLSPLGFQLAEFIVGHLNYLLLERVGVDGVPPAASGCPESSPAEACLDPAGSHLSRQRAPLTCDTVRRSERLHSFAPSMPRGPNFSW